MVAEQGPMSTRSLFGLTDCQLPLAPTAIGAKLLRERRRENLTSFEKVTGVGPLYLLTHTGIPLVSAAIPEFCVSRPCSWRPLTHLMRGTLQQL